MAALIYDSTSQAYKDTGGNKIYSSGDSAYVDAGGKVWNGSEWVDVLGEKYDGVSLIPLMTSNTTPKGVASASREPTYSDAYHAFSRDLEKRWTDAGAGTLSGWLQYEFKKPVSMSKISYYGQQDIGGSAVTTTIKASLDGSNWTTLGTIVLREPWENYGKQSLQFTKNTYKFIRIEHPSVNNGVQIRMVQVYP